MARVKMSDRAARSERTPDAWTMGDLGVAWNAEREARAILAETETTWPERWTLYSLRGVREGLNSAIEAERLALAESLAAFVGA